MPYITLYHIKSHCITLNHFTERNITFHCMTLHWITLLDMTLHHIIWYQVNRKWVKQLTATNGNEARILMTPMIELTMAKIKTNHLAVWSVFNNIEVPSGVRSELASLFIALIVKRTYFFKSMVRVALWPKIEMMLLMEISL